MVSVMVVVELDSEEVVVAQVSSTFTVVLELNMEDIDFNYLPMDVVCNGSSQHSFPHLPSPPSRVPFFHPWAYVRARMKADAHAHMRTCAHAHMRAASRVVRVSSPGDAGHMNGAWTHACASSLAPAANTQVLTLAAAIPVHRLQQNNRNRDKILSGGGGCKSTDAFVHSCWGTHADLDSRTCSPAALQRPLPVFQPPSAHRCWCE